MEFVLGMYFLFYYDYILYNSDFKYIYQIINKNLPVKLCRKVFYSFYFKLAS